MITTLLALDSACNACSVALWREERVVASAFEPMRRGQAERLVPMIAEVMAQAVVPMAEVAAIGVTIGPGTFTGIRLGLATARGLALALEGPVIGLTTTQVTAAAVPNPKGKPILSVIESKRADVYVELFSETGISLSGGPRSCSPEQVVEMLPDQGEVLLCGDGAERLAPVLQAQAVPFLLADRTVGPDAIFVAQQAAKMWQAGHSGEFQYPPAPLYIRPPDVTPPKKANSNTFTLS